MATVKELLDSVKQLPVLPQTTLQVTSLLNSGKASAAEIEKLARTDEALSMAILRWANSAMYGRPGRAFTLKESITRLGNSTLSKILFQQQAAGVFANAGAAYEMQRGAMWRCAIGGALAAEELAREAKFDNPDLCFLCALLRDVGKVVLDAHFGGTYFDLVGQHAGPNKSFVDAEREALGFDHAELGAGLARRWGLPDRIVAAIAQHHNPPADGEAHDLLIDIVHAADIIALWAGAGIGSDGMQYRLADHVRTGLNIDRLKAERLIVKLWAGIRDIEAVNAAPEPRRATA